MNPRHQRASPPSTPRFPAGRRSPIGAPGRVVRRLRRWTWTLVACAGAMGLGVVYGPALQRAYYLARLDARAADTRVDAMKRLARLTRGDPDGAARLARGLVDAVTDEAAAAVAADAIATWAARHNETFRTALGLTLGEAADPEFLIRATWLERAGLWRPPQRSFGELLRREQLRLRSPDPVERRVAVQAIVRHRIDSTVDVQAAIDVASADRDPDVRRYAVTAASVCLGAKSVPILDNLLHDSDPRVRREAALKLAYWPNDIPEALADVATDDVDPSVRQAACWALGRAKGSDAPEALSRLAQSDPSIEVRRMAAWGLAQLAGAAEGVGPILASLLSDTDETVAWRAARGSARLPVERLPTAELIAALATGHETSRPALAAALGRCPPDGRIRDALGDALTPAVADHRWPLVLVVLDGLGAQGDGRSIRLLADLVSNRAVPPAYRYDAARLVARRDPAEGQIVLRGLMSEGPDEIREMAAWSLSKLVLRGDSAGGDTGVIDPPGARGLDAWAAALAGDCTPRSGPDASLHARPASEAERDVSAGPAGDWKSYGYELFARVLCGDEPALEQMDAYILNQHVSRVGVYATLLEVGDMRPLDLLLGDDPTVDARSLLTDARFGEVLATYQPAAPRVCHDDDPALQAWQLERLREYWLIDRPLGRRGPAGGRGAIR